MTRFDGDATFLDIDERGRLARDLREDLGARLLNQLRRPLQPDEMAEQTRILLAELRGLLDSLDPRRFLLQDCVQEWQASSRETLQASDIEPIWRLPATWPSRQRLNPIQRCYPALILREFLRNATSHSHPTRITVTLRQRGAHLHLCARHDGLSQPPAVWNAARGLRIARLRTQDLHGQLEWSSPRRGWLRMDLTFPLSYPATHAKRTRR